jgi:Lon protease-like protein
VEIPLFPLPNVVLFPNVILPLHIFEDRYKQMINICLESREPFGLVLLREGAQEETERTIHRVGTLARVVEVERLEAGRMNILCQGESRFYVSRFMPHAAPYWKGDVQFFEDEAVDPADLTAVFDEVCEAYRKAFNLGVQLNAVSATDLQLPSGPVDLSFMISYVLDISSEEKQKLLEMKSTETRLQTLLIHVDEVTRKLEQQVAYKAIVKKVRGNGDLGKPSSSEST